MARRTRKGSGAGWMILAGVLVAVAFAGAIFFVSGDTTPYRTTPQLEVGAYLENSNSLRGNVYRIEGEVLNSLAWSPAEGRLIAIGVSEGRDVLPVLVTTDFNHLNIQKGQKFMFLLEVDDRGVLKTRDLTKS
jgi:hypothetical protein